MDERQIDPNLPLKVRNASLRRLELQLKLLVLHVRQNKRGTIEVGLGRRGFLVLEQELHNVDVRADLVRVRNHAMTRFKGDTHEGLGSFAPFFLFLQDLGELFAHRGDLRVGEGGESVLRVILATSHPQTHLLLECNESTLRLVDRILPQRLHIISIGTPLLPLVPRVQLRHKVRVHLPGNHQAHRFLDDVSEKSLGIADNFGWSASGSDDAVQGFLVERGLVL